MRTETVDIGDVEFVLFEIQQVFENPEFNKYLAWLDAEFQKYGRHGSNQRKRPVDDVRWMLAEMAAGRL